MDAFGIEILDTQPVHGGWFCVQSDGGRWSMQRVRCWCAVERVEDKIRWVTAIGDGVSPIVDPVHSFQPGSELFVHGDDIAPNGCSWRNVYNDPPVDHRRGKDVSDVMQAGATR